MVNQSVADALATIDLAPGDISLVVNTHLHFDHCGQNAVFPHAAFYVQRAEVERCERESRELWDWFGFMNARWELLDGDAEVVPGVSVVATPGHTVGHQCVVVSGASGVSGGPGGSGGAGGAGSSGGPGGSGGSGSDVLIGDAAYTPGIYSGAVAGESVPGQAADVGLWHSSLARVRSLGADRVHFCHHEDVVPGP